MKHFKKKRKETITIILTNSRICNNWQLIYLSIYSCSSSQKWVCGIKENVKCSSEILTIQWDTDVNGTRLALLTSPSTHLYTCKMLIDVCVRVCVLTSLHHGTGLVEECSQSMVNGSLLGHLQSHNWARPRHQLCCPNTNCLKKFLNCPRWTKISFFGPIFV